MVIVSRRGWLRIVEASIAIMIIFGVLLVVNNQQNFTEQQDLTKAIIPLLEEISRNKTLRENIITSNPQAEYELEKFISQRIKQSTIQYEVVICESNEICSLPSWPQNTVEVYAAERIISSTLEEFSPKKIKIFLWRGTN